MCGEDTWTKQERAAHELIKLIERTVHGAHLNLSRADLIRVITQHWTEVKLLAHTIHGSAKPVDWSSDPQVSKPIRPAEFVELAKRVAALEEWRRG